MSRQTAQTCRPFFIALLLGCAGASSAFAQLPSRGTLTANNISFAYFTEGSGPTCLVVGYPLAVSRALSPRLKRNLRFVFLESRLTTPEERVGDVSHVTMDTLVDDIEQGRQRLGLDHICVLGHSIAGVLALEYARRYPQHVSHVVMHGTPPFWDKRAADAMAAYWKGEASAERQKRLASSWARIAPDSLQKLPSSSADILTYTTNAAKYFHDPAYDPVWLLEGDYWNRQAGQRLLGPIMASYDLGQGATIEPPVFLAIGRSDFIVPFHLWDDEQRKIPKLSYNLFARSGHYPMLEERERFDELLLQWLQRTSR